MGFRLRVRLASFSVDLLMHSSICREISSVDWPSVIGSSPFYSIPVPVLPSIYACSSPFTDLPRRHLNFSQSTRLAGSLTITNIAMGQQQDTTAQSTPCHLTAASATPPEPLSNL